MSLCSHLERVSKGIVRWDVVGESNLKKFFLFISINPYLFSCAHFLKRCHQQAAMAGAQSQQKQMTMLSRENERWKWDSREIHHSAWRWCWRCLRNGDETKIWWQSDETSAEHFSWLRENVREMKVVCSIDFISRSAATKNKKKTRKTGLKAVCRVTQKFIGIEHARRLPLKRE